MELVKNCVDRILRPSIWGSDAGGKVIEVSSVEEFDKYVAQAASENKAVRCVVVVWCGCLLVWCVLV